MVDSCGQVLVPMQVGEEVERQHRCEGNTQGQAVTQALRPAGTTSGTYETHPRVCLSKAES